MTKHFENFTMQDAKAHRMGHDKTAALAEYLHNLALMQNKINAKKGLNAVYLNKNASLVPVLVPLLFSAGGLKSVATNIVFMNKASSKFRSGRSFKKRA